MGLDDFYTDESNEVDRIEELKKNTPPEEGTWRDYEPGDVHPCFNLRGRIGRAEVKGDICNNAYILYDPIEAVSISSTAYVDLLDMV